MKRGADNLTMRGPRRGALLLEVVVALSIMVFALGMLGGQLVAGMRMIQSVDEQTRAIQLTDRILALLELDPETIARIGEEETADGDFGDQFPGWFWRVQLEPTDIERLGLVTVEVLHQTDPDRQESMDDARIARTLHMLKAAPQPIDLAADFGFSEEQLTQLAETVPIPDFDPTALDPQLIAAMITPETLIELLPVFLPLIQQMTGGQLPADISPEDIAGLLSGQFGGGLPGDPSGGGGPGAGGGGGPGGAGGNDAIRDMIRDALGDRVSEEELDAALQGAGGGGGPRDGSAGIGRRTIEDLNRERKGGGGGGRRGGG